MKSAIGETERRRALQAAYNAEHGITPESVVAQIDDVLSSVYERDYLTAPVAREPRETFRTQAELDAEIARLEREMKAAAANLDFERAASLRDALKTLRSRELGPDRPAGGPVSRVLDAARAAGSRAALLEVQEYVRLQARDDPRRIFTRPFYFRDVVEQFDAIGIGSLTVVAADRVLHRRGARAADRA